MDRKMKVLLATYSVDSRSISEAQQTYQWIGHVVPGGNALKNRMKRVR